MSHIVIKDLTESLQLDNEAMNAIVGGARTAAQKVNLQGTLQKRDSSILDNVIGSEKLRSMIPHQLS